MRVTSPRSSCLSAGCGPRPRRRNVANAEPRALSISAMWRHEKLLWPCHLIRPSGACCSPAEWPEPRCLPLARSRRLGVALIPVSAHCAHLPCVRDMFAKPFSCYRPCDRRSQVEIDTWLMILCGLLPGPVHIVSVSGLSNRDCASLITRLSRRKRNATSFVGE